MLAPLSNTPWLQAQHLLCDAGLGHSKLHSPDSISRGFQVVGFCQWSSRGCWLVGEGTSVLFVTSAVPRTKDREDSGYSLGLLSALPAPAWLGPLRAAKTTVPHSLIFRSCPFFRVLSTRCLDFQPRTWAAVSAATTFYVLSLCLRAGSCFLKLFLSSCLWIFFLHFQPSNTHIINSLYYIPLVWNI